MITALLRNVALPRDSLLPVHETLKPSLEPCLSHPSPLSRALQSLDLLLDSDRVPSPHPTGCPLLRLPLYVLGLTRARPASSQQHLPLRLHKLCVSTCVAAGHTKLQPFPFSTATPSPILPRPAPRPFFLRMVLVWRGELPSNRSPCITSCLRRAQRSKLPIYSEGVCCLKASSKGFVTGYLWRHTQNEHQSCGVSTRNA